MAAVCHSEYGVSELQFVKANTINVGRHAAVGLGEQRADDGLGNMMTGGMSDSIVHTESCAIGTARGAFLNYRHKQGHPLDECSLCACAGVQLSK
jgi:hypothetical protein